MSENKYATNEQLTKPLPQLYCCDEYRHILKVKFSSMSFVKGSKILTFIIEFCQIVKELSTLTEKEAIKFIETRNILSMLDPLMREDVRILQISGNMCLENLLKFLD